MRKNLLETNLITDYLPDTSDSEQHQLNHFMLGHMFHVTFFKSLKTFDFSFTSSSYLTDLTAFAASVYP